MIEATYLFCKLIVYPGSEAFSNVGITTSKSVTVKSDPAGGRAPSHTPVTVDTPTSVKLVAETVDTLLYVIVLNPGLEYCTTSPTFTNDLKSETLGLVAVLNPVVPGVIVN